MNIAIVMGGYSQESDISIKSGKLIFESLSSHNTYQPIAVHILPSGWFALYKNKNIPINKEDFSFTIDNNKQHFNVVINTIHGTPGEDGHLQAYWELIGLPFTGCSFYQSALTFNKQDTLSVLDKFGVAKANAIYLTKKDPIDSNQIIKQLGLPVFVKPNQSGSSLGVSKVTTIDELIPAINKAFTQDSHILIESELKGTEVSVGVIYYQNQIRVLGVTQIIPQNDFFDYESKYSGKTQEITPANINQQAYQNVSDKAKFIYEKLNMSGFSRIDFIIDQDNQPYFIEINTNPGLSKQSIFPQQAKFAKIAFIDLLINEINLALKKKPIWNQIKHTSL